MEAQGYPTVLAEDGEQALELLSTLERPCLVLADLLTLRIDWSRLFSALGPDDRMATLPMILVSVSAPEMLSRPAVVKRPVDFDILLRMVGDHCCGGKRGGGKAALGGDSVDRGP